MCHGLNVVVLGGAGFIDFYEMRYQASLEKSVRGLELSQAQKDLVGQVAGGTSATMDLVFLGDHAQAREYANAASEAAEQLRDRSWLARAHFNHQAVALHVGEWAAMRDWGDRGLQYAPRDPRLLGYTAMGLYQAGQAPEARDYVERLAASMRSSVHGATADHVVLAWVLGFASHIIHSSEDHSLCREAAEAVLAAPSPSLYKLFARASLAMVAADTDDAAVAAEQYAHLKGLPKTAFPFNSVRVLGLAAATMGDPDAATAHFEEAVAFCRQKGLGPELAWICFDYADTLLKNGLGTRPAMGLLDESLRIARELGMRPLVERIVAHRQVLGA